MLARVRGVARLAQLADAPRFPGSVVVEDAGRTSLAALVKPLAPGELIGLAAALARAVADMHRREVVHRDITPANIVLSDDAAPCLVDFALATSFAEIRLEFTHHSEIAGTMAYLAPEQTGRTGRPVDQRADLYGLGSALYELATGEPPFGTGPLPRLLHDHLARVPVPPAEAVPGVPETLSAIIMHLLEKEPDNRYQSADGLAYDLERLRAARADPGAAAPRVGEHDVPVRLLPPSRLAGRGAEITELRNAFAQALDGRCRGVLISAAPGVGKTALVDELRPTVTSSDGWFVTGKFDAYRRDLEFDASYQAFRALGRLLLAEPEDDLARVRARILAAVGPNAGLLTAVLPGFAALLPVPLDPGDPLTAQARAQLASARALRAIASAQRPVLTGHPLEADFSTLVRYEGPAGNLEVVGAWVRSGAAPPSPVGGRLPLGGHNVTSLVYETGRPERIDYKHDTISGRTGYVATQLWRLSSSVGVPVVMGSRLWGALVIAQSCHEVLPADTEARLAAFNELVGTAIANAEASAEVSASRARVVAAGDQVRRRIERDLHDGAQQRLVSLMLQLRQAQAEVPSGLTELRAQLDRAATTANSALNEVGEIARGIHPAILTTGGLRPVVRALAHRSHVPVRLEEWTNERFPEHVEVTGYYVIAEALTNATKHARASAVVIKVEVTDKVLAITIRDDGVGGADLGRGTGLVGLKDRVEALSGRVFIESPRGVGTTLRAELSLSADGSAPHRTVTALRDVDW